MAGSFRCAGLQREVCWEGVSAARGRKERHVDMEFPLHRASKKGLLSSADSDEDKGMSANYGA